MNDKSEPSDKTAVIKEIHNIEKTKVLLLRGLPFIIRLSKYYDLTLFKSSLSNKSSNDGYMDNKLNSISNLLENENKYLNQFDNLDVNKALEIIKGNKLDMDNKSKTDICKNIDDPV